MTDKPETGADSKPLFHIAATDAALTAFVDRTDAVLRRLQDVTDRFRAVRHSLTDSSNHAVYVNTMSDISAELETLATALLDAQGRLMGLPDPSDD